MSNYQPTYLGEIELNEDTLSHFGVKGMKWGRRKAKLTKDLINARGRLRQAKRRVKLEVSNRRHNKVFSKQDLNLMSKLGDNPSYGEDDRGYASSKGYYSHKHYITDVNNSNQRAADNRKRRSMAKTDPRYKKKK